MNQISKSSIVLLSESIWIYYGIALFASVEMNYPVFVSASWWLIAGLLGYSLNALLAARAHYLFLVIGNMIVLGVILYFNWQGIQGNGSWIFGIVLSIAVSFVFVRSASFVYRKSTRKQMLHRFEGNIIFYALLSLAFIANGWGDEWFHLVFLMAIFLSLIGMILSLQAHGQNEGDLKVEVQKVGQSGWFAAIISLLFIGITLASSLLFLPTIRQALYSLGLGGLGILKWLIQKILAFITWLFGLLPKSEMEGEMPLPPPQQQVVPDGMEEELGFLIPIEWIIGILIVIVAIAAIWILATFLKKWQPPKRKRSEQINASKYSWWKLVREKGREFFLRLKLNWRKKFIRYYEKPIYWYYEQVLKWGKQNGLSRLPTETTKEYISKLEGALIIDENEPNSIQLLHKLNADYEAAYYGQSIKASVEEYKQLLLDLNAIQLKKKKEK